MWINFWLTRLSIYITYRSLPRNTHHVDESSDFLLCGCHDRRSDTVYNSLKDGQTPQVQ